MKAQKAKSPPPTKALYALIEDEEQKKERNRERVPNPTTLDHLVVAYNLHGSYGWAILNSPHLQGRKYLFIYLFEWLWWDSENQLEEVGLR